MSEWKPIETAPKDGSVIQLMKWHDVIPTFYSAWWAPAEEIYKEFEGHYWVLNDDDSQLIEEDEDMQLWYWKPLPQRPTEKE
jgi:hypothetical protein